MDLTLNDTERAYLAGLGVAPDAQGELRSAGGRAVNAATAVALLTKAAMSPEAFRRPALTEGHADASALDWTTGYPGSAEGQRQARTGPAGSGTADRAMRGPAGGLDGGSGDQEGPDLTGGGTVYGLAKMTPDAFRRHYLAAGHQADSPGTTGRRGVTPEPGQMAGHPGARAHVAEAGQFGRGPLTAGHQADPPGSDAGGNNDQPPGTPAHEVYAAAERRWAANRDRECSEHLTPSTMGPAAPLPERVALPSDMRAGSVPMAAQAHATKPAPGEC